MYHEALDTVSLKDNFCPRDFFTSDLPSKLIKMICKPYSKWIRELSGKDSKSDSLLDGSRLLKSHLACLSEDVFSYSKSHINLKEQDCCRCQVSDYVGGENNAEVKTKVRENDSEQLHLSAQKLMAEIASLSRALHDFSKTQMAN